MSDVHVFHGGEYQARRLRQPAIGFTLADPFDEILRRLDEGYLFAAHEALVLALTRFGLDHPVVPGSCHTGRWRLLDDRRPSERNPLEGFGWVAPLPGPGEQILWTELHRPRPHYLQLDSFLATGTPALRIVHDPHRAQRLERVDGRPIHLGRDGVAMVAVEAADETADWFGWYPDFVRDARTVPTGLWVDAMRAVYGLDAAGLEVALVEGARSYTEAGWALAATGVANVLAFTPWLDRFDRFDGSRETAQPDEP